MRYLYPNDAAASLDWNRMSSSIATSPPPFAASVGPVYFIGMRLARIQLWTLVLEGRADALLEQPPFGDAHFAVCSCRVPQQVALDRVCNGLVTHRELNANAVSFFRLTDC